MDAVQQTCLIQIVQVAANCDLGDAKAPAKLAHADPLPLLHFLND
jgi:hypothetical protein